MSPYHPGLSPTGAAHWCRPRVSLDAGRQPTTCRCGACRRESNRDATPPRQTAAALHARTARTARTALTHTHQAASRHDMPSIPTGGASGSGNGGRLRRQAGRLVWPGLHPPGATDRQAHWVSVMAHTRLSTHVNARVPRPRATVASRATATPLPTPRSLQLHVTQSRPGYRPPHNPMCVSWKRPVTVGASPGGGVRYICISH